MSRKTRPCHVAEICSRAFGIAGGGESTRGCDSAIRAQLPFTSPSASVLPEALSNRTVSGPENPSTARAASFKA